jgi:cell division protein FtsB
MKKQVEIWHLIIYGAIFIGSCLTALINQSNRITRDESEILTLEKSNDKTDQQFNKVNDNLDKVNSRLTDILIELQNKKDRDK